MHVKGWCWRPKKVHLLVKYFHPCSYVPDVVLVNFISCTVHFVSSFLNANDLHWSFFRHRWAQTNNDSASECKTSRELNFMLSKLFTVLNSNKQKHTYMFLNKSNIMIIDLRMAYVWFFFFFLLFYFIEKKIPLCLLRDCEFKTEIDSG